MFRRRARLSGMRAGSDPSLKLGLRSLGRGIATPTLLIVSLGTVLGGLLWAPELAHADDRREPALQLPVLRASDDGRRRVRGGRPDGASIHVAWAAPVRDPDAEDREALAAFERATFPSGKVHQTIVDEPPEPWMRKLRLPELPIRWNRRTIEYLRYFKEDPRGQAMMRAWMIRAGRYEARMRKILKEAGVPSDLVMVALAESGFNPRARSRVGAGGLWQFMEGTGNVYGLASDYWVDLRFDIDKSTLAAAMYLKDLHVRFGSWELALAAYNAGYGLVLTSIDRNNTNNYWALCEIESGLPYATTNYVPKIMAAAIVSANREVFGVGPGDIEVRPAIDWVEVRVPQSTALSSVAKAIDVDEDLLAEINAHLVRGRTPPRKGSYGLRIPRDKVEAFKAAGERLRKNWNAETTYRVRHGEQLEEIAAAHGLTERELRRLNGVEDSAEVSGGVTLIVPTSKPEDFEPPETSPPLAAVPPLAPAKGHRLVFFVTNRAVTPRTIETAFGIRWSDVVGWNDLDPHARLQSGQVLQLVVPEDFDPVARQVRVYDRHEVDYALRGSIGHLEAALSRRGLLRRGYRVRKGDTLGKIGRRFDLTVGDLARINDFSRSHEPEAGDLLVIYVPDHRVRGTTEPPAPKGFDAAPTREASTADTARLPGGHPGVSPPTAPVVRPTRAPSSATSTRIPGDRS